MHADFWIGRYRIVLDFYWKQWVWHWNFKPPFSTMLFCFDMGPFGMEVWRSDVALRRRKELTDIDLTS